MSYSIGLHRHERLRGYDESPLLAFQGWHWAVRLQEPLLDPVLHATQPSSSLVDAQTGEHLRKTGPVSSTCPPRSSHLLGPNREQFHAPLVGPGETPCAAVPSPSSTKTPSRHRLPAHHLASQHSTSRRTRNTPRWGLASQHSTPRMRNMLKMSTG